MKKLFKRFLILYGLIFLFLTILFFGWCLYYLFTVETDEEIFTNKLVEVVKNDVKNKEKKLDLTEVTDFDWDKVYLFDAYTQNDVIEEVIGTKFDGYTSVNNLDYCSLLVFTKDSKVVFYVDVKNVQGDFSINNRGLSLKRDEAKFEIIKTKGKNDYYKNYYVYLKTLKENQYKEYYLQLIKESENTRD